MESGFTLTEIMVVLIVIGIIAAAIIPQFIGTTQDAKVSTAKGNVAELESAVERFYVHLDRYPTSEEGLKVLVEAPTGEEQKWRGPYIKMLRPDPWGNPYQFRSPGVHHTSSFDIWSRGADNADGGLIVTSVVRAEERADCPFVDLPSKQNGQWVQGITPSMMRKMHWVNPVFVCEIKFAEWTRDGKLRAPVFLGLREDKRPGDVVREG